MYLLGLHLNTQQNKLVSLRPEYDWGEHFVKSDVYAILNPEKRSQERAQHLRMRVVIGNTSLS